MNPLLTAGNATHELRFAHLLQDGRGYVFPCDLEGRVDMDGLSETMRLNYLFARGLVGRDYAIPVVQQVRRH